MPLKFSDTNIEDPLVVEALREIALIVNRLEDESNDPILTKDKIRLLSTSDASESSTNHAMQIGLSNTFNVRIDNNEVLALNNGVQSTLFLSFYRGVTATTAQLEDITHKINTDPGKIKGVKCFNTTTSKPVWAFDLNDNSTWRDATGSVVHSPV